MDEDYEVVPDSLRRRLNHRGRPTRPEVLALIDGKTVRFKPWVSSSSVRGSLRLLGYKATYYTDDENREVVWVTSKKEAPGDPA